jgi:MAF protein
MRRLILASSSVYRKTLLERLGMPFEVISPSIDETRQEGETPTALVRRLAVEKARAAADKFTDALIIGSDQCAVTRGTILGKPLSYERAFQQLKDASGRAVNFHNGLCLLDTASNQVQSDDVPFTVYFRRLTDTQISHYLHREKPFDCAGSFKAESLGIALFARMQGDDPSALVGLPLIRLVSMLASFGVEVL